MKILSILARRDEAAKQKNPDTSGYITKEEMQKLRQAAKRQLSPLRKKSFRTWECQKCEHKVFYTVMRCPLCESDRIKEKEQPLIYEKRVKRT